MVIKRACLMGLFLVVGCGPAARSGDDDTGDDDDDPPVTCTSGQNVCVGNEVRSCVDGQVAGLVETCSQGCSAGACVTGHTCDASGVDLVYVVDASNVLYSFEPRNDAHTFSQIGVIDCPGVGPDLGGAGVGRPMSMSVDRTGMAWVHYTSGQIFKVSIMDASCSATSWVPGTQGFELFGMGFVLDAAGSDSEHLFIAGGSADFLSVNLGSIDPASMSVSTVGPLGDQPELSGTGAGELYAYLPQQLQAAPLDKTTGQVQQSWDVSAAVGGQIPAAYAMAHWGGRLYIFTSDGVQGRVGRLDLTSGAAQLVVPSNNLMIVGAGVSTCAPITIE